MQRIEDIKKDLSQVNHQLHESLAIFNERYNGTLATPLNSKTPQQTPKTSRGTDSTDSISQNRENVNPESQKGKKAGEFSAAHDHVRGR